MTIMMNITHIFITISFINNTFKILQLKKLFLPSLSVTVVCKTSKKKEQKQPHSTFDPKLKIFTTQSYITQSYITF